MATLTQERPETAPAAAPERMAHALRFLTVDAVAAAQSGHPGMPMGMADVATVLFTRFLRHDPQAPRWHDRDRFVLSAGHGSMLLYALQYLTGYADITLEDLKAFRKLGSKTAGHPEYGNLAGIEATTGPLGQGFATAVGMALAERMMRAAFGADTVDHYTYVMAGDGCLMEGLSQEALSFAAHQKLDRLICFFDDNAVTIDGMTDHATGENQLARFQAAGWDVRVIDGHDHAQIAQAIRAAKAAAAPSLIACKTVIGYGSELKAGKPAAHFGALSPEDDRRMRETLGWEAAAFDVPADVLEAWRAAGIRSGQARLDWTARLAALPAGRRAEFERRMEGRLPDGWEAEIDALIAAENGAAAATRMSTGRVLEALAGPLPELVGGSADLAGSTQTWPAGFEVQSADNPAGRYIPFGVREHAMAAIMNGLSLHGGFLPYGGTFLCFIDYARPALRLSALMGLRALYVMTHDAVTVGEDGPTHQPVEHLAGLRATPGLDVYRPCDMIEAYECWKLALAKADRPAVMCLSRNPLPPLRGARDGSAGAARGGYVLREATGTRQVTLIATGSEVQYAVAAREMLEAEGIGAAVVSLPCWSLFDAQPRDYRDAVLCPDKSVAVSVEAQSTLGWERYVGRRGKAIGLDRFGESGPASELMAHFGFTAAAVAAAARSLLAET
ncbi:transketolase [Poseidonocella sp. HB161398]|uniref:transketolase n=1 Tax=Poseidonocella sp. HB161398 TaxID=2320855 RepID=UPI001F10D64F|nr:transketolase [Poseidonocella sp. HB161398]